jgi:hypothetical protein
MADPLIKQFRDLLFVVHATAQEYSADFIRASWAGVAGLLTYSLYFLIFPRFYLQ